MQIKVTVRWHECPFGNVNWKINFAIFVCFVGGMFILFPMKIQCERYSYTIYISENVLV